MDDITRLVLELAAQGLIPDEIAGRLGMSVDLVRECVRCAIDELGAHSKLEAVVAAIRQGIVRL